MISNVKGRGRLPDFYLKYFGGLCSIFVSWHGPSPYERINFHLICPEMSEDQRKGLRLGKDGPTFCLGYRSGEVEADISGTGAKAEAHPIRTAFHYFSPAYIIPSPRFSV